MNLVISIILLTNLLTQVCPVEQFRFVTLSAKAGHTITRTYAFQVPANADDIFLYVDTLDEEDDCVWIELVTGALPLCPGEHTITYYPKNPGVIVVKATLYGEGNARAHLLLRVKYKVPEQPLPDFNVNTL